MSFLSCKKHILMFCPFLTSIAKCDCLEPRRCEDIKGIVAPEIDPKSFGTFEKQATGVPRIPDSNPWISDLDSGFQTHGFHRNRSWIPSNDSNSVDSGFHTMDFGFHSLDPGFWIPKPHICRIPDSGFLHIGRVFVQT